MRKLIRILVSSVAAGAILVGMTYLGFRLNILTTMAQGSLYLGLGSAMMLVLSVKILIEKEQIVNN